MDGASDLAADPKLKPEEGASGFWTADDPKLNPEEGASGFEVATDPNNPTLDVLAAVPKVEVEEDDFPRKLIS